MQNNTISVSVVSQPSSHSSVSTSHSSHTSSVSHTSTSSSVSSRTNAPPISSASTEKEINAYVSYYTEQGYTVTTNQQDYKPEGTIQTFHFAANRDQEASHASVRTSIDAATHSVSTSESSHSSTQS